ncbi:MAG: Na+/phosphate symporter [Candidatus Poriferisodalaceae bacterium]|jgi:Na+/phosphate symporter
MVLSFFKKSTAGLDHVVAKSVGMLGDARHSFDLATSSLLAGLDHVAVAEDIRATDQRINETEQELRSELVVHVSVHGSSDIGSVLGLILLLKKIERIGDQAKNILDLAENGVSLQGEDDIDDLLAERALVSAFFSEAAERLAEPDEGTLEDLDERISAVTAHCQASIDGYLTSDRPGREVVPRAIYHRYLKRIAANLLGVVRTATEPIQHADYEDGGATDTDD